MTLWEHRQIVKGLKAYSGAVNEVLWAYLSLCIERKLTKIDQQEILTTYLGHKKV